MMSQQYTTWSKSLPLKQSLMKYCNTYETSNKMTLVKWFGLCFLFLQNVGRFKCEDAVVCRGVEESGQTIDCGLDRVIQVHKITTAYIITTRSCGRADIIAKIKTKIDSCKTSNLPASLGCHGSQQCPVSHHAGTTLLKGCTTTNVLHISYSCLELSSANTAVLPLYQEKIDRDLQIFSPGFPNTTLNEQFSFHCVITPARSESGAIHMEVMTERLHFYPTNQCTHRLYFVADNENKTIFCSNAESDLWKAKLDFTAQTLKFVYEQIPNITDAADYGGLFWLHVRDFQGQVDLKITCPDQSQIPGYSTPPPSTTTTSPTTTVDKATVKAVPGKSTENKKEGIGTGLLAGVLSAVGLVLIVVVIIVFLIFRMRKRKLNKANEETVKDTNTKTVEKSNGIINQGSTNVRVSNEYVYSDIQEDENHNTKQVKKPKERNKKPRHEVYEDVKKNKENMYAVVDKGKKEKIQNNDNTDIGAMYAVVDKNKETKMDHIDNDETVICENDELYEPGLNTNVNGADKTSNEEVETYAVVDKEKTKDTKLSDADETIVYENDDLYEPGPIVPNNNANVENEKDVDEETEMYENNELYSGAEDMKNTK